MNPVAIEGHLKLVLLQWLIIVGLAWVFGRLARRVGQPLAVGEIVAGLILGPSCLGALWPEGMAALFPSATQQSLQLLAKVGLILLLLQVGMEFDYGHLRSGSRTVVLVSVFGLLTPLACGFAIGPWLHRTFAPQAPFVGFQLFVAIALSISALPILGRILMERGLERSPMGALGISAAAIDDVVGWILLAAAAALVQSGFAPLRLLLQVGGVLLLFGGFQWVVGPVLCRVWRRCRQAAPDDAFPKSFLALLLVVLFGACLAASALGIFSLFGAFLLGVSLHRQRDLVAAWRDRFSDFVLVAMVPIFFTNTGLRTEIGGLASAMAWWGALVVLAAAVAGKLGGCLVGARLAGQTWRDSLSIGALMNTRALMGLVAINLGLELKLITGPVFTMFVLMALVTTAMTTPLLDWAAKRRGVQGLGCGADRELQPH